MKIKKTKFFDNELQFLLYNILISFLCGFGMYHWYLMLTSNYNLSLIMGLITSAGTRVYIDKEKKVKE